MPLSVSDLLSSLAVVVSGVALLYARRSASAAEASAKTAHDALAFQRESHATEQSDIQDARLSALAREALEDWPTGGSLGPILTREISLSEEEQADLARRVYQTQGRTQEDAMRFLVQWRESRAKRSSGGS